MKNECAPELTKPCLGGITSLVQFGISSTRFLVAASSMSSTEKPAASSIFTTVLSCGKCKVVFESVSCPARKPTRR